MRRCLRAMEVGNERRGWMDRGQIWCGGGLGYITSVCHGARHKVGEVGLVRCRFPLRLWPIDGLWAAASTAAWDKLGSLGARSRILDRVEMADALNDWRTNSRAS